MKAWHDYVIMAAEPACHSSPTDAHHMLACDFLNRCDILYIQANRKMCKNFPYFLEKRWLSSNPTMSTMWWHPAPVSDDVMAMGPAYQIRGPMTSMDMPALARLHSDDIMAVGLLTKIEPIWVPRPQPTCKQANLRFQTSRAAIWQANPLQLIFKPSKQPNTSLKATCIPGW